MSDRQPIHKFAVQFKTVSFGDKWYSLSWKMALPRREMYDDVREINNAQVRCDLLGGALDQDNQLYFDDVECPALRDAVCVCGNVNDQKIACSGQIKIPRSIDVNLVESLQGKHGWLIVYEATEVDKPAKAREPLPGQQQFKFDSERELFAAPISVILGKHGVTAGMVGKLEAKFDCFGDLTEAMRANAKWFKEVNGLGQAAAGKIALAVSDALGAVAEPVAAE